MKVSVFKHIKIHIKIRKCWIIAVLFILFLLLQWFFLAQSRRVSYQDIQRVYKIEITENPQYDTNNEVWTTKTAKIDKDKQHITEDVTSFDVACRLPLLDPNHSSVRNLIVDFGRLDCGTSYSTFENNTLNVHANDVVSVSYRVVNRPEGNDFDVNLSKAFTIPNAVMASQEDRTLSPEKPGCLMHIGTKKCLHPFGGGSMPQDGTALVFHLDCCFKRTEFKITKDTTIVHGPSGLCMHVNMENKAVTLRQDCSSKFTFVNGIIHVADSDLCIESADGLPRSNEHVIAGSSCSQQFSLISTKGRRFNGSANIDADFIRVDINRGGGKPDITEVHMQTAPKPDVLKRKRKPIGISVNIGLIMFDSTSAANFIRQMSKTNEYLKRRPTIYMKGNTIVGDGTTAQLCAMLTGIPEKDEPEARRSKPNSKVVDDWRWVFRDYRNHGFVTMLSEDSPSLGTFNYRLHGFKNPPTDHYGRYFWMEADRHQKASHCTGNEAIHRLTFKYFLSLFRTYVEHRKIALTIFSDLSHDNMNSIKYADEDFVKLLKTMEKENFLDDTILFIFGDHGKRFGEMRQTLQGKLEERLPHMSITFPTWFPERYPKLYEAVQHNSHLLTTPFDTYATLQHVLSYPYAPKGVNVGQSLFYPIDANQRTCANAGVEDHWCPCLNFESVPLNEKIIKKLVSFSVKYINKQLENEGSKVKSLCHKLTLKEIKSASRDMPNDKVQKFKRSHSNRKCDSCGVVLGIKSENTMIKDTVYQIQFVTSPNNGFYEASVRVSDGEPRIQGSISRIDEYGHQPDCISDTYVHLLKYCYCKVQRVPPMKSQ